MKNIIKLTKLELIKYVRQPMMVGFGIVFPIVWILLNGAMFGNDPSPKLYNYGTVSFMLPAYIFMIALVSGLSSLPLTIAKNYETKAIVRYSFTPMKRSEYIVSLILGNYTMVLISSIVMFAVTFAAYKIDMPRIIVFLELLPGIFLTTLGVTSLGILIASLARGFQSTLALALFSYFILLFITGASVPMPVLPDIFQKVSSYIPFSHMVLFLQDIWLQRFDSFITHLSISLLITTVCFIPAVLSFKWSKR